MPIQEIFKRMQSGEVAAHSELGTRDESKQTKQFEARLPKFKATVGVKAHALVMKDVVLPFNPFTGEPDDQYNEDTKFRPILLVSQVLSGVKAACAENPDVATKWESNLGIAAGDINWAGPVVMDDYYKFKAAGFIAPRIMTYPTVSVNFNGINGFPKFRQRYTVDPTDLDAAYMYPPEKSPVWNEAAGFFGAILRPEAADVEDRLKKSGANQERIQSAKREIFSKAPIGFVAPTNLIPFIYLPMDSTPKAFDPENYSSLEGLVRWYSYQKDKWGGGIDDAMKSPVIDENMDFFDLTIRTPSVTETKKDGTVYTDEDTLELYNAMTITTTDSRYSIWTGSSEVSGNMVKNAEAYEFLWKALAAYFEHSQEESFKPDGESFEKLMAVSNRFRPITSVQDMLLSACNEVFIRDFAESPYFTENIKRGYSGFLVAMNKDNAMALADVDDDDLDAAKKTQQKSLSSLIHEVRETAGENDALQELALEGDDPAATTL